MDSRILLTFLCGFNMGSWRPHNELHFIHLEMRTWQAEPIFQTDKVAISQLQFTHCAKMRMLCGFADAEFVIWSIKNLVIKGQNNWRNVGVTSSCNAWQLLPSLVFTALHAMQTRSSE